MTTATANRFLDQTPWIYRNGCRIRARRPRISSGFTLGEIINRENLVRTFRECRISSGPGPGIDGFSPDDFSVTEFGAAADVAIAAIRAGRWRPRPPRIKRIPKGDGRSRELAIRCVVDRIISAAVAERVTLQIDPLLSDGCFGYRPGRCVHLMLATIAHFAETEDLTVITQDDIADAFPSVRIRDTVADYARHTTDPGLLRLIEAILRGHDSLQELGLDQGDPLSPPSLNLRLHYCLDLPASGSAVPDSPRRYRYSDNLVYQSRSVAEGHQALQHDRALLDQNEFRLKGTGNCPVNLRRNGASAEVLGFRIRMRGDRVEFGLGQKAYRKLAAALERAHEVPESSVVAREVIHGWIGAQGPAFESDEMSAIPDTVYQIAAEAGFREIGSREQLSGSVRDAQEHWQACRRQVSAGITVGDGICQG